MKYVKKSPYVDAYDAYEVTWYSIDKYEKRVFVNVTHVYHTKDGFPVVEILKLPIEDREVTIVDPDWNENSIPPKPANFSLTNPSTWGDLRFDEIPTVLDKRYLYASRIIESLSRADTGLDEIILSTLIDTGKIPGGNKWTMIKD